MKKRIIAALLCLGGVFSGTAVMASSVALHVVDESSLGNNEIKAPRRPLIIDIEDNVITMPAFAQYVTLLIRDEDENTVYSTIVFTGSTTVVLPSWLSGDYELVLTPADSSYYFYGHISLT